MARARTLKNIYDKKHQTLTLTGGFKRVMGDPEYNGLWLIYGRDKNGKTWFALKLADELSRSERVLYVSAEEGFDKAFRDTCLRVGLDSKNKRIHVIDYEPIGDLLARLKKPRCPRVVFIDNATIYKDDFKGGGLVDLLRAHPRKLFVLLAHEERNEPYTAPAKLAHKLAKVIVRVRGLSCQVHGRCPGGELTIDESRGKLFWGHDYEPKDQEV